MKDAKQHGGERERIFKKVKEKIEDEMAMVENRRKEMQKMKENI